MTDKEVVLRAVKFMNPPRIPIANGGNRLDMAYISYDCAAGFKSKVPGENEWGAVWRSLNKEKGDQGQVISHPLADWDDFEKYKFPDPYAQGRFDRFGYLE